jgi:hypothetical protein
MVISIHRIFILLYPFSVESDGTPTKRFYHRLCIGGVVDNGRFLARVEIPWSALVITNNGGGGVQSPMES